MYYKYSDICGFSNLGHYRMVAAYVSITFVNTRFCIYSNQYQTAAQCVLFPRYMQDDVVFKGLLEKEKYLLSRLFRFAHPSQNTGISCGSKVAWAECITVQYRISKYCHGMYKVFEGAFFIGRHCGLSCLQKAIDTECMLIRLCSEYLNTDKLY